MELDILRQPERGDSTEVGSYFVANYPPFSVWSAEHVPDYARALSTPPRQGGDGSKATNASETPLGLYLHIPFCRKRCHFCYFRVYTDKNSSDVDEYLTALGHETALYARQPALEGREFDFVYFGGGTPSFLSSEQLARLVDRIREHWNWDHAREVTFECEPGTLKKGKLETIRDIGVTRLSLGVEHFDDEILAAGNRAHKSRDTYQAYEWAREVGFPQINIDLIAGMVGETDEKWASAVERALALDPDNITIYQMEVPHNTTVARDAKATGASTPVASWARKRQWVDHAFRRFESAGYVVSSAYTLVKKSNHRGFVYRDALWRGADLIGMGVASFGHLAGVHYQNADKWESYVEPLSRGALPIARALSVASRQLLLREMILQLKLGRIEPRYFQDKFGADILREFRDGFDSLAQDGFASASNEAVTLTREGLLRVDSLLPRFYEPLFRSVRYT